MKVTCERGIKGQRSPDDPFAPADPRQGSSLRLTFELDQQGTLE